MARRTLEDKRLLVADALRHLHDIPYLQDYCAELTRMLRVEPVRGEYWGEGSALSVQLRQVVDVVTARMEGIATLQEYRACLLYVVSGGSISQWASTRNISREQASRHYWRRATELVTKEVVAHERTQQAV